MNPPPNRMGADKADVVLLVFGPDKDVLLGPEGALVAAGSDAYVPPSDPLVVGGLEAHPFELRIPEPGPRHGSPTSRGRGPVRRLRPLDVSAT